MAGGWSINRGQEWPFRWSRYLVIDFSHPLLKSTRQRAKYQGRDCPASVNVCSERAKRLPPTIIVWTLPPLIRLRYEPE